MKHIAFAQIIILLIVLVNPTHSQEQSTALIGNWDGSYTCAQGITGLTLVIDRQEDTEISGYYHFYSLKDNPQVLEGCYHVQGQISALNHVKIKAEKWIFRPAGYIMVGLEGEFNSTKKTINGDIVAPSILGASCTNFTIANLT